MKIKLKIAALWFALVTSDTALQIFLKIGAVKSTTKHTLSPYIVFGYGTLLLSFVLWMQILKTTRLSLALSATSIVYVTVALAASKFLNEPLSPVLLCGCLFIGIGVFVMGGV